MKKLLLCLGLLSGLVLKAQYNNEWIDYNKTYFKFKVGATGLYRISQSVLQSAGIGSTPAEQLQLWRNGKEIPVYTSVSSGAMGPSDFIEFWGEINDGKTDKKLYRDPNLQLSDKWSLLTDTAAYFLTVNPTGPNARVVNTANNVAGNVLPAEPYFMHTIDQHYRDKINPGFAAVIGEYVHSSSYDIGEGWTSREIRNNSPLIQQFTNLQTYSAGPNVTFKIAAVGTALNGRGVRVFVNGNLVIDKVMDYFNSLQDQTTFPVSLIGTATDTVRIANTSLNPNDRMVVSNFEMTYPRLFNFGGATSFSFKLPANINGNYIEISNFNFGTTAPVLYDFANNKRYSGDISVPGLVRFALEPSSLDRNFILTSVEGANVKQVNSLTVRNFVNYANAANQGDYLIISNSLLYNGSNGNPVDAYRQYRSSAEGGGYNAKIYDIDQLVDQFAFGIKKHPLSVKNFIDYSRNTFPNAPRYVFIIGRGITYNEFRYSESTGVVEKLDLVPSFGSPASDNILASGNYSAIPAVPIGRLAAVTPLEVEQYLNKIKQHELVNTIAPQTIAAKGWMKNVVHAIGGSDPYLQAVVFGYMNSVKDIIEDTLFGAKVYSFSKNSAFSVQQLTSAQLQSLFTEGINLITYFGHSSANTLEFNLDDPSSYNNTGKYPVFIVNGCNAGNFFIFDSLRLTGGINTQTLSEKFVLADQKGGVAFLASTHYGIVNYLNIYTYSVYSAIAKDKYGQSIGEIQKKAIEQLLTITGASDYYGRLHSEEIALHGDPAIKMYMHNRPDYVVEDPQIKISPSFISVADNSFKVVARFVNIGKAVSDSVGLEIKRQLPDGSIVTLVNKKVRGIRYEDSVVLNIPINPLTDKGTNKLIVTVDGAGAVPEVSESNNSVTKEFYIIEDDARPVSPHIYSIVPQDRIKFFASIANPFSQSRDYIIEVDTTELFNSAVKASQTVTSSGGILQFDPNITLQDSTVYYWRVSAVPQPGNSYQWNSSSFVCIKNSTTGFAQAHYFQQQKNTYSNITLTDDRVYHYNEIPRQMRVKVGLPPFYVGAQTVTTIDENRITSTACQLNVIKFVVLDSASLKVWPNYVVTPGKGRFGSIPPCAFELSGFSFQLWDTAQRRLAMQFIDSIPNGQFVLCYWRGWGDGSNTYVNTWMTDTARLGSGVSLYHKLRSIGLTEIDSFTHDVPFFFFFKKGRTNYPIYQAMGKKADDYLDQKFTLYERLSFGTIESPLFGPSNEWKEIHWRNTSIEPVSTDTSYVEIYGVNFTGQETKLATVVNLDTTLSFIDAKAYPYLKLKLNARDRVGFTPAQMKYWLVNGTFVPEGTVAPNILFSSKDTLDVGEPLNFQMAFKNISETSFDSVKVKMLVTKANNVTDTISLPKMKPLVSGDTFVVATTFDTKNYPGANTIFLDVNPDFDQPEQYRFNNFLFRNFYVRPDTYNPLLDVTFDGVHILNKDIVSAKPHVLVKLKDDSRWLALTDTSLLKLKVRYPNGTLREFRFDNDTVKFTPSGLTPGGSNNTATIDFTPYFSEDGEYELIVTGTDVSGNKAGQLEYRVVFSIINKAMISNLLNYPNPFTTSTAFVFTITGSEVPQNMRIQILTITGKIVREVTKDELGPLRIGRNITEFKWDGTDQYGQKLANGVYLYRVITNLNGKSLEKYRADGDNTDKFFKSGYGKMYLMR
jgi:hypothetical protein